MIQGKGYAIVGTMFFSKCLNLVKEYVTKTDSKQIEVAKSNHTVPLHDDIIQSLFDDSFDTEETIPKIILIYVTPIQDNESFTKLRHFEKNIVPTIAYPLPCIMTFPVVM
jgi:hypothetical protein